MGNTVKHPAVRQLPDGAAYSAEAMLLAAKAGSLRNPAKPGTPFLPVAAYSAVAKPLAAKAGSHRAFWRRRVEVAKLRPAKRSKPRILFGATYSSIEPLGLLYLSGLARDFGWEAHIRLVRHNDFTEFRRAVKDLKPEVVGFTCYTGNHMPVYACFDQIRRDYPGIRTVIGGPHATYFPKMSLGFADNVVVSEGFDALTRILKRETGPGIIYPTRLMTFPQPERSRFYKDYPEHKINPIKNIITMTGCPFACTYCYNSSSINDTMGTKLNPEEIVRLKLVLGASGRLFPINMRDPASVIQEINNVMELAPETKLFYWQDDTLGVAKHLGFLDEFLRQYTLKIPFHGQTRFEMINPITPRGREVLEKIGRIGFTGLTMAIEAADTVVRKEILNRAMPDAIIFDAAKKLGKMGFRLRTEQITGLPYGATTRPTKINLEADLELLSLNMNLRRASGGLPNMSWATTLIPYLGTRMSDYCVRYGFVSAEAAENPEDGYHERSVLRHLRQYVGPELIRRKDDSSVWLEPGDQDRYHDQNTQLRYMFHILAYLSCLPDGERFVERHLRQCQVFSVAALNEDMRAYAAQHPAPEGRRLHERIGRFENRIPDVTTDTQDRQRLRRISAFCGLLPGDGLELARRYLRYSNGNDEAAMFSNIVKKYLFDTQVYLTGECTCELYNGTILSNG